MKTLLTLVLAVAFSQAYAESYMSSGAPGGAVGGGATTTSGAIMNSPNANQPTFGSEVPYKGTTTGTMRRNDTMNNVNTTSDTIGTTQSSTTTIKKTKERRVIPITPANTNSSGVNCVDRSGRSFGSGDSGYTACVNSMRMR